MIQENPDFNDKNLWDSSLSWINNFDIFTKLIYLYFKQLQIVMKSLKKSC